MLTVIFNIVLLYCYIQGKRSARRTKRALSESHTNPVATEEEMSSERNNNRGRMDVEKQGPLPPLPESPIPIEEEEKPKKPSMMPSQSVENK